MYSHHVAQIRLMKTGIYPVMTRTKKKQKQKQIMMMISQH